MVSCILEKVTQAVHEVNISCVEVYPEPGALLPLLQLVSCILEKVTQAVHEVNVYCV
jgi:hypothetical protein